MTRIRSPLAFSLIAATMGPAPAPPWRDDNYALPAVEPPPAPGPAMPPGLGGRRAQRLEQKRKRRDLKRRGWR
jgi:hypothetical protein